MTQTAAQQPCVIPGQSCSLRTTTIKTRERCSTHPLLDQVSSTATPAATSLSPSTAGCAASAACVLAGGRACGGLHLLPHPLPQKHLRSASALHLWLFRCDVCDNMCEPANRCVEGWSTQQSKSSVLSHLRTTFPARLANNFVSGPAEASPLILVRAMRL